MNISYILRVGRLHGYNDSDIEFLRALDLAVWWGVTTELLFLFYTMRNVHPKLLKEVIMYTNICTPRVYQVKTIHNVTMQSDKIGALAPLSKQERLI